LRIENQYIIHYKGLKEGVHHFEFSIEKPFFDSFEYLEVPDGKVNVQVELTRKVHFLDLDISLAGSMMVQCDRCLGYFDLPVSYNGHLMVRFREDSKEPDDEVIFLHPEEQQLDLKHYFYECISLSIPLRKVHPDLKSGKPGCDPEMMRRINDLLVND
jgi:uncharacterized protein